MNNQHVISKAQTRFYELLLSAPYYEVGLQLWAEHDLQGRILNFAKGSTGMDPLQKTLHTKFLMAGPHRGRDAKADAYQNAMSSSPDSPDALTQSKQ